MGKKERDAKLKRKKDYYSAMVCVRCKTKRRGWHFAKNGKWSREKWCKYCDPYWSKRFKAMVVFNKAIRDGIIVRPKSCPFCKKETKICRNGEMKPVRICGHHEDYDRPLDVVWICSRCHCTNHVNKGEDGDIMRIRVKGIFNDLYNNLDESSQPMTD